MLTERGEGCRYKGKTPQTFINSSSLQRTFDLNFNSEIRRDQGKKFL